MSTAAADVHAPRLERVIVAVGAEAAAPRLLRIAGTVAAQLGLPADVATVVARGAEDMPEHKRLLIEAVATESHLEDAEIAVLNGWSIADTLVAYVDSRQPALLCVATSVRTRADDLIIGSMTGSVLHRLSSPVLVIGPNVDDEADPFVGPILIADDGSSESASVRPLVRRWSPAADQKRVVVTQVREDTPLDPALEQRGAHNAARAIGADVEWEVLRGSDPGGAIADYSAEVGAGLVIMATHGRSALGRVALGSTAMRVVHRATCPVLLQRPPLAPESPGRADDSGGSSAAQA